MQQNELPSPLIQSASYALDAGRIRAAKAWSARLTARLIAARGLTQKAAAVQAQTSQTRISNIKNGVLHATGLDLILVILERLGATVTVDRTPARIHVTWTIDGHAIDEHFQF